MTTRDTFGGTEDLEGSLEDRVQEMNKGLLSGTKKGEVVLFWKENEGLHYVDMITRKEERISTEIRPITFSNDGDMIYYLAPDPHRTYQYFNKKKLMGLDINERRHKYFANTDNIKKIFTLRDTKNIVIVERSFGKDHYISLIKDDEGLEPVVKKYISAEIKDIERIDVSETGENISVSEKDLLSERYVTRRYMGWERYYPQEIWINDSPPSYSKWLGVVRWIDDSKAIATNKRGDSMYLLDELERFYEEPKDNQIIYKGPHKIINVQISPDKRKIAFISNGQLMVHNFNEVTSKGYRGNQENFSYSWAHDSNRLAYEWNPVKDLFWRPRPNSIILLDENGKNETLVDNGVEPMWQPR